MPRVRLDLTVVAFQSLTQAAVRERRPIDWQTEVPIEAGTGIRTRRSAYERPVKTPKGSERPAGKAVADGRP